MLRFCLIALMLAVVAFGATIRLYLKDGSYQIAREYTVEGDRVRYYSTERSEWEELPLELVDLEKTRGERKRIEDSRREEVALMDAEEKAERAQRAEAASVPVGNGVYLPEAGKMTMLPVAESKIVGNRKRSILKVLSPIPIVPGKSTLELDGTQSKTVITTPEPEFYIRLSQDQPFGIARLKPLKKSRLVENITTISVSNEVIEEPDLVEIFRRQVGDGLYKFWPAKPLEPGEYAVIEYTAGKLNIQVWDFSYRPAGGSSDPK
jgi:hypothetical protein